MKKDERIRFTLRLPDKLFALVGREAEETGVSVNAMILQILKEWAEERKSNQETDRRK
ncbi:MAG: Arc family DNA-binding protein [Anaerovoracaceae bacterium]